jgi:hypothetical protein
MIIGITGCCEDPKGHRRIAGSGKDELAKCLMVKHKFVSIAWADPMKRFCKEVLEFTDEQLWGGSEARVLPDLRYPRPKDRPLDGSVDVTIHDVEYLTPRYALQALGTGWGRTCYDRIWVDYGVRQAKLLLENKEYRYLPQRGAFKPTLVDYGTIVGLSGVPAAGVVFSDLRYFNEYYGVRDQGGKVVRVKRYVDEPFDMKGMDHTHSSERELLLWDDSKFDYVIENSGTLHMLQLLVDTMVDVFKGKIIPFDEDQADTPPFLRKKPEGGTIQGR